MAIAVPVIGRRTVIQRITFGIFGKPHSRGWLFTGPIAISFHFISNAINAYSIRGTPGFEQVNAGQLILFWCTRPRLSWMIVTLVPWQAKDEMYFSVAASTLLAEIVLQLVSSYYMGRAVNYARVQEFFKIGRLDSTPHGDDAMTMYGGALLWLVVIFFALLACGSAILGVDQHIASLRRAISGAGRKAKRHKKWCVAELSTFIRRKEGFSTSTASSTTIPDDTTSLEDSLRKCAGVWKRLSTYVTDDAKEYTKVEAKYMSISRKVGRENARGNPQQIPADLVAEFHNRKNDWYNVPRQMRDKAKEGLDSAELALKEAEEAVSSLETELRAVDFEIKELEIRLEHLRATMWRDRGNRQRLAIIDELGTRLAQLKEEPRDDQGVTDLLSDRRYILSVWRFAKLEWEKLFTRWTTQADAREKEDQTDFLDPVVRRLRNFAMTTVAGMFGCWVAQWVWWVGYVRTMGDSYCLPNLTEMGVVWTVFSAIGALFGGSF
jgi:hypothetical protein